MAWWLIVSTFLALFVDGRTYLVPHRQGKKAHLGDYNYQSLLMNYTRSVPCDDSLPVLSVGTMLSTAEEYIQFKKAHKFFLLGLTSSHVDDCPFCCGSEQILNDVSKHFESKTFSFETKKKSEPIQIARVDASLDHGFLFSDKLMEHDFPIIYVVYEGRFYPYDNTLSEPRLLIQFLNRLLHPLLGLKKESEVEAFLDLRELPNEQTKFFKKYSAANPGGELLPTLSDLQEEKFITRVLVLVYDREDYNEEIAALKMAGRNLAGRGELRMALVTDKKLVKKLKRQTSLFENEGSFTSLVVKRYDGELAIHDLMNRESLQAWRSPLTLALPGSADELIYTLWLSRKSMKLVEPLTHHVFPILTSLVYPQFFAFVDFQSRDEATAKSSIKLVNKIMPELAQRYETQLAMFYLPVSEFGHARKKLGITHSKLPAIAVSLYGQNKLAFSPDYDIDLAVIQDWFRNAVFGKDVLEHLPDYLVETDGYVRDRAVVKHLTDGLGAPLLTKANIAKKIGHEKDIVLMVFTSEYPESSRKNHNKAFADVFVSIRQKFAAQKVTSVKFFALDVNQEQGITDLGEFTSRDALPAYLLLPAEHKRIKDIKKYYGKLLARDVVRFIHKNADISFQYRDALHMDYLGPDDEIVDDEFQNVLYIYSPEDLEIERLKREGTTVFVTPDSLHDPDVQAKIRQGFRVHYVTKEKLAELKERESWQQYKTDPAKDDL